MTTRTTTLFSFLLFVSTAGCAKHWTTTTHFTQWETAYAKACGPESLKKVEQEMNFSISGSSSFDAFKADCDANSTFLKELSNNPDLMVGSPETMVFPKFDALIPFITPVAWTAQNECEDSTESNDDAGANNTPTDVDDANADCGESPASASLASLQEISGYEAPYIAPRDLNNDGVFETPRRISCDLKPRYGSKNRNVPYKRPIWPKDAKKPKGPTTKNIDSIAKLKAYVTFRDSLTECVESLLSNTETNWAKAEAKLKKNLTLNQHLIEAGFYPLRYPIAGKLMAPEKMAAANNDAAKKATEAIVANIKEVTDAAVKQLQDDATTQFEKQVAVANSCKADTEPSTLPGEEYPNLGRFMDLERSMKKCYAVTGRNGWYEIGKAFATTDAQKQQIEDLKKDAMDALDVMAKEKRSISKKAAKERQARKQKRDRENAKKNRAKKSKGKCYWYSYPAIQACGMMYSGARECASGPSTMADATCRAMAEKGPPCTCK